MTVVALRTGFAGNAAIAFLAPVGAAGTIDLQGNYSIKIDHPLNFAVWTAEVRLHLGSPMPVI